MFIMNRQAAQQCQVWVHFAKFVSRAQRTVTRQLESKLCTLQYTSPPVVPLLILLYVRTVSSRRAVNLC